MLIVLGAARGLRRYRRTNYEPMVCAADCYTDRLRCLHCRACALSPFRRSLKDKREPCPAPLDIAARPKWVLAVSKRLPACAGNLSEVGETRGYIPLLLCPDCGHEWLNAHDVHDAGEIVGENV
jgi:hypothetical protein